MAFNIASYLDDGLSCAGSIMGPFRFENPTHLGTVWVRPRVTFGRNSYMNDGYIREDVTVGRFCSIGRRVSLAAGEHPPQWLTTHPIVWNSRRSASVYERAAARQQRDPSTNIGHDVFIGDNVVVLPGVSIGTGAVVGANAVVTKDVPCYAVVGGVPAQLIRQRFPDKICAELLESEWWMLPDPAIHEMEINDIVSCLKLMPELRERFGVVPFAFKGDVF